jgi:NADPH:quinone reductase-like Zn-dependent oxidoreductase
VVGVKAIVQDEYGSADVLELRDVELPDLDEGGVLVRVHAAGVDPGVWHVMAGRPRLVRVMGNGMRRPRQPVRGTDFAGVVESVGDGVVGVAPGDEVYGHCDGSFAEFARTSPDRIAPKPRSLSFEQAAALPVSGGTALVAVRDVAKVRRGQSVLVIGAGGGVGGFAVQVAAHIGARVTGACSTYKLDFVRLLGAADVIDYTVQDFTDGTRTWDVVIDTAGRRPISKLHRALTSDGVLTIVGGDGGGPWLGGFQRQMLAPARSTFTHRSYRSVVHEEQRQLLLDLNVLVETGAIAPRVTRTYELAEAPDAVRYVAGGHALGKAVVRVA